LQAQAEGHAKVVVAGVASAYFSPAMKINPLPAGFVVPAQPVKALKPPVGKDWVHEIKHDGYRIIVRRDGPTARLGLYGIHRTTLADVPSPCLPVSCCRSSLQSEDVTVSLDRAVIE
jgi:hypothetical protein